MTEEDMLETPETEGVDVAELYKLCAVDNELYARTFFPKTFRQASPEFHKDYWQKIEDPSFDFFAAEVFRGGGKTTLARVAISKRIAYALSRNVLNVAINESMSLNTARWLKKQVEFNTLWSQTYGLSKGQKWADDQFEVNHNLEQIGITVTSKGMTSGLRGLNLDDYRPDFIYCDDIQNEENTKTEESLQASNDLFFGALAQSLAPKSEAPHRKFVLTQTAIVKGDIITSAHKDPTFTTVKYPKILQSKGEDGEVTETSAWPERWSLEEVLKEKEDYRRRRMLYVWLRECGCKLVGTGETPFEAKNLLPWQSLPPGMVTFIGIDPAISKAKKAHKAALVVIGMYAGTFYLLDSYAQKGQSPDEIWSTLCTYVRKWRPIRVGVETVAFQKMLKWYFEKKMQEENFYFPIYDFDDRREKTSRILQAYSGIMSQHRFCVNFETQGDFFDTLIAWTPGEDVDVLDAGAIALSQAQPWMIEVGGTTVDEKGKVIDHIAQEEKAYADLEDNEEWAP